MKTKISTRLSGLFIFLAGIYLCLASVNSVFAEEPCDKFLNALREARMFDVALDYLEQMEQSNLASKQFKRRIPLAKVSVLLDEIGQTRDPQKITEQLDRTEQVIDAFIGSNPPSGLLAEAQQQRSRISLARARRMLDRAKSDRITEKQKVELQTKARAYLQQAAESYDGIRERLKKELEEFDTDSLDPNWKAKRDQLRNSFVMARMKSPLIKEQIADSYGAGHPQYNELLNQAAVENLDLYDKYRKQAGGLDGAIGAARCFQKLGDLDKALGYLTEVFEQPRGAVQTLKKREAALVAIDCWEAIDPFPTEEVFQRLQKIVYGLEPNYRRTVDGIRMQMVFARACRLKFEQIKATGPQDQDERKQMNLLEREASNIMRNLIRIPGDHRQSAREFLATWGKSVATIDESGTAPTSLAEAREKGKDIQLVVAELKQQVAAKQAVLASAAKSDVAQLESEVAELNNRIVSLSNQALAMFEMGFGFADEQTATDDLTILRYLQCASYFQMNRYFETVIIGEFLIDRFPENSGARQASGLVCKAYWQMYRESDKASKIEGASAAAADARFELQQMKKHCEFIFKKWPVTAQAETAGLLMTLVSLSENDPAAADRYLEKIPAESPNRAKIVLEVGNRLWQQYVSEQRNASAQKTPDEMRLIRDQAQKLLENGIEFLDIKKLLTHEARSTLSLTELYLDAGLSDQAIHQLETAPIAPLDLIKQKHPAANNPKFRQDTYKTSLRAYLAKLRDGVDTLSWVEKSQGVIGALKDEIGDSPEGKRRLSSIYLTLAKELKAQFVGLQSNDERAAFADGLETFLTALSANADDRQLKLLTGSMLTEIGASLAANGLPSRGKSFFGKAIQIYDLLRKDTETDARTRLIILRGRANSLSGGGQYEDAIKQFGDILQVPENRRYVDIQVDAARAYRNWGIEKGLAAPLASAILGGEKRKNAKGQSVSTILGWDKLAKSARRSENKVLFAECVYNIAECKFQYGKLKTQPEMQQAAIDEIKKFKLNDPAMGGPQWKEKFQVLQRRMEAEFKK